MCIGGEREGPLNVDTLPYIDFKLSGLLKYQRTGYQNVLVKVVSFRAILLATKKNLKVADAQFKNLFKQSDRSARCLGDCPPEFDATDSKSSE